MNKSQEEFDKINEEKMEYLKGAIKKLLDDSNKPIGEIETDIGVSKGYFSRINNRTPDLRVICRLGTYFDIDYDYFFCEAKKLSYESEEYIIDNFLQYLNQNTKNNKLKWVKRINMISALTSPGIRKEIYINDNGVIPIVNDYHFTCNLPGAEKIGLFKVQFINKIYYELCLENELIYASINDNNVLTKKKVRSLFATLDESELETLNDNISYMSKTIMQKYIKE